MIRQNKQTEYLESGRKTSLRRFKVGLVMEEKKYLNDLLLDTLAQYPRNSIYDYGFRLLVKSPTGSGKNYFTQHGLIDFINSDSPNRPEFRKILFITSRAATTTQYRNQLIKEYKQGQFKHKIWRLGGHRAETRVLGLEPHNWKETDIIYGHKWDLEKDLEFVNQIESDGYIEFIVIDEIHGLSSDDFTTASPTALDFVLTARETTSIILMSAITERLKSSVIDGYEQIDFSDTAIKVEPRKIEIVQQKTAQRELRQANEENKILYFVETTDKAYQLEREYLDMGIRACAITSKPNNRINSHPDTDEQTLNRILAKSIAALECLEENERFPDDIDLIITSSKLREGINIKDKRNKLIITELRDSVSLIQCAGRNRYGVDKFMIVDGLKQNVSKDYGDIYKRAKTDINQKQKMIKPIIEAMAEAKQGFDERMVKAGFITELEAEENKQRYKEAKEELETLLELYKERYDSLIYYSARSKQLKLNPQYYAEQQQKWQDFKECKEDILTYVRGVFGRDDILYSTLAAEVERTISGYLDRKITKDEKNELLDKLNNIVPKNKEAKKKIGVILEPFNYECIMLSDKRHYMIKRIENTMCAGG
jgi:hypothetical protein